MKLRAPRIAIVIFLVFASSGFSSLTCVQAQETAQEPVRAGASITGRVVAEDGRPIAGATIAVRPVATPDGGNRTTGTDDEGRFVVTDLDSGAYTLNASAPGYIVPPDPNNPNRDPRFFRRGDTGVTLTLAKGGVITGKVTDNAGAPVVGVGVRAIMTRDAENRPPRQTSVRERATDDRGIYRIYGIEPGTYLVSAGSSNRNSFPRVAAYDGDAPTYHPSATSDTATPVIVRGAAETSGVDIIYRGTRGHTVSGKLLGASIAEGNIAITVSLVNPATNILESTAYVYPRTAERGFSFDAVPDGTYRVFARRYARDTDDGLTSPTRTVVVKGADITGLELALAPFVLLTGQVRLAASDPAISEREACRLQPPPVETPLTEAIIRLRRNERPTTQIPQPALAHNENFTPNTVPDERGNFRLRNLEPGSYRFDVRLPDSAFYVQNITLNRPTPKPTATKPATRQATPNRTTGEAIAEFVFTTGERLPTAVITIANGAARIAGNVERSTARTRVHLIPALAEHANHAWRYYETLVAPNGTWTLINIAPGTYRLIALRSQPEAEYTPTRPRAADIEGRLKLRRQAEANGTRVELSACSRLDEYALRVNESDSR